MNDKLHILLDAAALLILEQKAIVTDDSDDMVYSMLKDIEKLGGKELLDADSLENRIASYIYTIIDDKNDGNAIDVNEVTKYITVEILRDTDLVNTDDLISMITSTFNSISGLSNKEIIEKVMQTREKLAKHRNGIKAMVLSRKLNSDIRRGNAQGAYTNLLRHVLEADAEDDIYESDAIMSEVMFDSTIRDNKYVTEAGDNRRVYKTGLSYYNDTSGGGFKEGECIIQGALSHQNKSGISISACCGIPILNKFEEVDGKKPLYVHLSFEDPYDIIIKRYYETIYMTYNNGEYPDLSIVTITEMTEYVRDMLSKNGMHVLVTTVNPTLWGYNDMFKYIRRLEAKGYKVLFLLNDYLDKLGGTGLDKSGPIGSDKKELLRKTRNHFAKTGVTYFSPWQYNSKLKDMITQGLEPEMVPKFAAGKSMYQGNGTLDTDIDLEYGGHISTANGESFMGLMRGKHRGADFLPEDSRYGVYKFPAKGPLLMDAVLGKRLYKKSITAFGISSNSDDGGLF